MAIPGALEDLSQACNAFFDLFGLGIREVEAQGVFIAGQWIE